MGFFGKKQKNTIKLLGNYDLEHILGLSIPENINCIVELYSDRIIIKPSGYEYNLSINKIRSCDFKMDIDVKQYIKNNIVKGIAGGIAFGIPGAIAFSSPRVKDKREIKGYAIINYQNNNGELTYLILRDIYSNSSNASKLVDKLRTLIKNIDTTQINL